MAAASEPKRGTNVPEAYTIPHPPVAARIRAERGLKLALVVGLNLWVYLSIYLLMPLGPVLMPHWRQLLRYAAGIMLISLLADMIFVFWPTIYPRPGAAETTLAYRLLVRVDNPFHAFPSFHAAFAVYSAFCAGLVRREMRLLAAWEAGVWLWTALILFATLATKQHMFADIVAGSALGGAAFVCVFNRAAPDYPQQAAAPASTDQFQPQPDQT